MLLATGLAGLADAAGGPLPDQSLAWGGYVRGAADPGGGTPQMVSGVPVYLWQHGCGPTAAGMVLGYWDAHGYPNLVAGDASTQTTAVNNMMASAQHYSDYSLPIDDTSTGLLLDKSSLGGAHLNNSVADYMRTSWSSAGNYYGWSWFSDVDNALDSYANLAGYAGATASNETWGAFTWSDFTAEINAGRPMVFLVDSDADGSTDHFVPAIGYDAATQDYACYNTWDRSIHWYDFAQMAAGRSFGIYGATYFNPGSAPASIDLQGYDLYVNTSQPVNWGQTITLQGQVYNAGGAAATATFYQDFYLSNDTTWGDADDVLLSGYYTHSADVPASGYGPDFTVSVTLPASPPSGYTSGNYYIGMVTDADSNVIESNETNNGPGDFPQTYDWNTLQINSPVVPTLSISDASISEGDSGTKVLNFSVSLSAASSQVVTVNYATANGSATAGSDYVSKTGTLTFPASSTTPQTISVTINGDYTIEGTETVVVNLSGPTNATLADGQATGTITNDDLAGTIEFASTAYSAGEAAATITITVVRNGGLGAGVGVSYASSNGSATAPADYTTASGTLTFAGGEASRTFTIALVNDSGDEPDETVNLTLSNPTGGASLGSPSTTVLTIVDDDLPVNSPPVADAGGPYVINEGQSLTLDGSGCSDPDGDNLSYAWDVNGDGLFIDATGVNPMLSWSQLGAIGIHDGPMMIANLKVRVSDTAGNEAEAPATSLTVHNVALVVSGLTLTPSLDEGGVATLSGSTSDVPADSYTLTVDWGEGTPQVYSLSAGSTSFSVSHAYVDDNPSGTTSDTYQVSGTLVDDDGGSTPLLASGPAGSLDARFGIEGKVLTPIGGSHDDAYALAIEPDGQLVAAGRSSNGSDYDFALVRYNPDGTPDSGFGTGGHVITAIGAGHDDARALTIQPDGKLVAAGFSSNGSNDDFALVRYKTDGSLDTSFGSGGKVVTAIGSFGDRAYALAVQPDGKLVAAGYSVSTGHVDFALVRYNANGTLDGSFGMGGKVLTRIGNINEQVWSLVIQPDGKVVAAGPSYNGSNYDIALVRYNADGSLDEGFGSGGKVVTAVGTDDDLANYLILQPNGRLVVTGQSWSSVTGEDFAVVRYNADGSLDSGFGSEGKVITSIGSGTDVPEALALQSDGKLVAAGYSSNGSNNDFALVRYNADGSLDEGFGLSGKVFTAFGSSNDVALFLAVQADGGLVAAGRSFDGLTTDFAIARYNASGLSVTVNNVAPTVDVGSDQILDPPTSGHLTGSGSFTDPGSDTWQVYANYDYVADDSARNGLGTLIQNGTGTSFSLNHAYGAVGTYTVRVTVVDDDGGVGHDSLAVNVVMANWDVDGNGQALALSDGLLIFRYLFEMRGAELINGAVAPDATRQTAAEIEGYLNSVGSILDVDGNGQTLALTDGILIFRYLFGMRGVELINGAVSPGAPRDTAAEIESYMQGYMPIQAGGSGLSASGTQLRAVEPAFGESMTSSSKLFKKTLRRGAADAWWARLSIERGGSQVEPQ